MAQQKLDCFFHPKGPRLEERGQDNGNSEILSEKQVSTREVGHTDSNFSKRATFARVSIWNVLWWNRRQRNHERFLPCPSRTASNFVPLIFLQGPYFSAEGALRLLKAKSWSEHWISIQSGYKAAFLKAFTVCLLMILFGNEYHSLTDLVRTLRLYLFVLALTSTTSFTGLGLVYLDWILGTHLTHSE